MTRTVKCQGGPETGGGMAGERVPSMADIARALGLTRQAVALAARAGMPVTSAEAAHAWRLANLDPARRKRGGFDAELATRSLVEAAHELMAAAADALAHGRGQAFEVLVPALQEALRAVPESARDRVLIPVLLMDRLCADSIIYTLKVEATWRAEGRYQDDADSEASAPFYSRSSHAFADGRHRYTAEDLQLCAWGWLWYGVAADEVRHDWIDF